MFSTLDLQHELHRFRQQLKRVFHQFDRVFPASADHYDSDSFAAQNDPYCMEWSQPLGFDRAEQNALTQTQSPRQTEVLKKEQEQKQMHKQKEESGAAPGLGPEVGAGAEAGGTDSVEAKSDTEAAVNRMIGEGPTPSQEQKPLGHSHTEAKAESKDLAQSEHHQPIHRHGHRHRHHHAQNQTPTVTAGLRLRDALTVPRVNVVEKADHFLIECDLPGMAKEEVQVSVSSSGILSINAQHSEKHEQKDEKTKYHRVERSYGKYSRSMQLPDTVDADAVKAKHENGVLQLTLPKKPKEILESHRKGPMHVLIQ